MISRPNISNDLKSGRLGNKLFMIAACIGVAEIYNDTIAIEPGQYSKYLPNIPYQQNIKIDKIYVEPTFTYNPIPYSPNLGIIGYFQSEKYFSHCKDKIRKYFDPAPFVKEYANNIWKEIGIKPENENITVIQVRRDDYLEKSDYHTVQTLEYYKEAMNIIQSKTSVYLIFCDQTAIPWCKENFKGDNIIIAPQDHYFNDIYVMSQCSNYIIANSTFGWWGAWLNPSDKKTVIAPKNWFGPAAQLDDKDLIPEGWIRI